MCTWLPKKSKALLLVPKCCKFAASAKWHLKQFFRCTYEHHTKLVASNRFLLVAMKCTPNSPMHPSKGCENVKCSVFGTKKDQKQIHNCFSLTLWAWKPQCSTKIGPTSTIQPCTDCQKVQSTVFSTKMLQIGCKCKKTCKAVFLHRRARDTRN